MIGNSTGKNTCKQAGNSEADRQAIFRFQLSFPPLQQFALIHIIGEHEGCFECTL